MGCAVDYCRCCQDFTRHCDETCNRCGTFNDGELAMDVKDIQQEMERESAANDA